MLVLSRQEGQSIVIDGGIIITVVAVNRDKVRIGIKAPPTVQVDRQEVYLRRLEEGTPPTIRPANPEPGIDEAPPGNVSTSV